MMNKFQYLSILFIFFILVSYSITPISALSFKQDKNIKSINTKNSYSTPAKLKINNQVMDIIKSINRTSIQKNLEHITSEFKGRVTGTNACQQAGDWIYHTLNNISNLKVRKHQWFSRANIYYLLKHFNSFNVEAELTGSQDPNKIIIFSAQYDVSNEDSPGALDNGAGIASLLEIAQSFAQYSFNYTIRFIAFSGEEQGLLGSYEYAKESYEKGETIIGVINADVIGNNTHDTGDLNKFRCFSTFPAYWIVDLIDSTCLTYNLSCSPKIRQYYGHSDDKAFDDYGYPAMQLFQSGNNMEPFYGTMDDTISLINLSYLSNVTTSIAASLAVLANYHIDPFVEIISPKENSFYIASNEFDVLEKGNTIVFGKQTIKLQLSSDVDTVHFLVVKGRNELAKQTGERQIISEEIFTEGPFEWQFDIFSIGWYTIRVIVYNERGFSYTDEIELINVL